MNGESTTSAPPTDTPAAAPTAEAPKADKPQESTDAALKAFNKCSEALAGLHINDVKKVLSALSTMHFGR